MPRLKSKNSSVLKDFTRYCKKNPTQRFWQALRDWSRFYFIVGCMTHQWEESGEDTYYFEGKDK